MNAQKEREQRFEKIYDNLPYFERIQPICPLKGRVYSWADVKTAMEFIIDIRFEMLAKLEELDLI